MDKETTQEQVQEFWEWCGFLIEPLKGEEYLGNFYYYPKCNRIEKYAPSIDLNNLFKYAWKKAIEKLQKFHQWTYRQAEKYLFNLWQSKLKTDDYEDALFWAIWEVIHQQLSHDKGGK